MKTYVVNKCRKCLRKNIPLTLRLLLYYFVLGFFCLTLYIGPKNAQLGVVNIPGRQLIETS